MNTNPFFSNKKNIVNIITLLLIAVSIGIGFYLDSAKPPKETVMIIALISNLVLLSTLYIDHIKNIRPSTFSGLFVWITLNVIFIREIFLN